MIVDVGVRKLGFSPVKWLLNNLSNTNTKKGECNTMENRKESRMLRNWVYVCSLLLILGMVGSVHAQSPYGTVDVVSDKATTESVVSSLKITYTVGKAIPLSVGADTLTDATDDVAGIVTLEIDLPVGWMSAVDSDFWNDRRESVKRSILIQKR